MLNSLVSLDHNHDIAKTNIDVRVVEHEASCEVGFEFANADEAVVLELLQNEVHQVLREGDDVLLVLLVLEDFEQFDDALLDVKDEGLRTLHTLVADRDLLLLVLAEELVEDLRVPQTVRVHDASDALELLHCSLFGRLGIGGLPRITRLGAERVAVGECGLAVRILYLHEASMPDQRLILDFEAGGVGCERFLDFILGRVGVHFLQLSMCIVFIVDPGIIFLSVFAIECIRV